MAGWRGDPGTISVLRPGRPPLAAPSITAATGPRFQDQQGARVSQRAITFALELRPVLAGNTSSSVSA